MRRLGLRLRLPVALRRRPADVALADTRARSGSVRIRGPSELPAQGRHRGSRTGRTYRATAQVPSRARSAGGRPCWGAGLACPADDVAARDPGVIAVTANRDLRRDPARNGRASHGRCMATAGAEINADPHRTCTGGAGDVTLGEGRWSPTGGRGGGTGSWHRSAALAAQDAER